MYPRITQRGFQFERLVFRSADSSKAYLRKTMAQIASLRLESCVPYKYRQVGLIGRFSCENESDDALAPLSGLASDGMSLFYFWASC